MNELNREFQQEEEKKVVVCDLTYVKVKNKWHYICVFVDLFNREIIVYSTEPNKDAKLGIAAGLPIMKKQGFGQFINISSIGGHEVSPTAAVYCATKFAVRAISEGLRMEVGEHIRVTTVSPGVTESELAESISDEEASQVMKEYRKIAISPDSIARTILFAIEQPADVDVNEIIVRPTAAN